MLASNAMTRPGPSFFRAVAALAATLAATVAFGQMGPKEGVNYTVVKPTQATDAPAGKVEVIEFFGYWCPHCNDFEPVMADWSKRNDARVKVVYVPFAFQPMHVMFQKLYYALDALGVEREMRRKVFNAVHTDRTIAPDADVNALGDWVAKNGVDKKKFIDTYNSFAVQTRVSRANQIAQAYGVSGVPMLGIGGKYLMNVDARSIGNADFFLARVVAGT